MDQYYVYILASKKDGVLYIGVTNSLISRVHEHKNNIVWSFTNKYYVHKLVYYEIIEGIENAIFREKQLKKWNRQWKMDLIQKNNPDWEDLYNNLI